MLARMTRDEIDPADVKLLRAFNRTYTQRISVLEPYLGSTLSLTEVRILYELAHQGPCAAADLARELALDGQAPVAFFMPHPC